MIWCTGTERFIIVVSVEEFFLLMNVKIINNNNKLPQFFKLRNQRGVLNK